MKNLSLCKETEWAYEVTHDHTRLNDLLGRHSEEKGRGKRPRKQNQRSEVRGFDEGNRQMADLPYFQ
jgi:hypothetical protein